MLGESQPPSEIRQFVDHIRPRNKQQAQKLLDALLQFPNICWWTPSGELFIEGRSVGNLYELLR